MARKALLYGCFAALLTAFPVAAQQDGAGSDPGGGPGGTGVPGSAPQTTAAAAPQPAAAAPPPAAGRRPLGDAQPKVIGVVSQDPDRPNRASLGEAITVEVQGLGGLLSPDSQVPVRCGSLILFLNEIPILGGPPESCNPVEGKVRFLLDRTDKSDRAWHILLEEPIGFEKPISVSIGANQDLYFPTDVRDDKAFELEVLPRPELFGYFAILAVGLVLFIRLVRRTTILRDTIPAPEGKEPPYSLSRFQLAFWSLLVIAAYVFIWMITEELDTITGSVLVLLGVGSGTALAAVVIDSGKPAAGSAPPVKLRASQGFFTDLISDDNGVSLSKFQLFVWTLVLGVIFCSSVYDGLEMPQFSTTLLGLMGLSSGTYLGFKVPENKAPAADDKS